MEVIRISAVWCSSCLVMKSRVNEVAGELNIKITDYDYDIDSDMIDKYDVSDILPVIIKGDKRLVGEHTKEEIRKFLSDQCEEIFI